MSFLRLLSPARGHDPSSHASSSKIHSSSNKSTLSPTLTLHIPAYGAVFMNPPTGQDVIQGFSGEPPRDDQTLNGQLEIVIPPGFGPKRCKFIRVGLKTTCKLNLGQWRMGEEDTIFERKVEIDGGEDGLLLEEGTQKFDFTLILPATLAAHDWHRDGEVSHDLFAELEGLPDTRQTSSSILSNLGRSRHQSRSRSRHPSRAGSRAGSPRRESEQLHEDLARVSISGLPRAPPYERHESTGLDDWLTGSYDTKRTLMLIYNPDPSGGVTELDERISGFASGLGMYELRATSPVWSICALVKARFKLTDLSPATSCFCFRIMLSQTTAITSPRDDQAKPLTHTRYFTIIEEGKRPPKEHHHPGKEMPTIWRGVAAGGSDQGDFQVEKTGRLPNDDHGRPSTLPGIVTPIKVTHSLISEVYFAVQNETDQGTPMARPGPGGLRVLRIQRPIVLPSCALTPHVLNLPSYDEYQLDTALVSGFSELTKTPSKLGSERRVSSTNALPLGIPKWTSCACGQSLEQMEERMRSALDEQENPADGQWKQEQERGRRR